MDWYATDISRLKLDLKVTWSEVSGLRSEFDFDLSGSTNACPSATRRGKNYWVLMSSLPFFTQKLLMRNHMAIWGRWLDPHLGGQQLFLGLKIWYNLASFITGNRLVFFAKLLAQLWAEWLGFRPTLPPPHMLDSGKSCTKAKVKIDHRWILTLYRARARYEYLLGSIVW